jgi:uncharacterized protein (DUF362 family)
MSLNKKELIFSSKASKAPASNIFAVTETNGADDGIKILIDLMGKEGLFFYNSNLKEKNCGSNGLIKSDDVVLIKVNSQWDERGGTNTDLVKELIQIVVNHPEGFKGEIIVADNGQAQYGSTGQGGSLDYKNNNALDKTQSIEKVVDNFKKEYKISTYLWDKITTNVVSEYHNKDNEDGYVVNTKVNTSTDCIVSYPKFTTEFGTQVSFKFGIWKPEKEDYMDKLRIINVPVLKTHMIFGVTASVKHYMGVPSDKLTRNLGYRIHDKVGTGAMGTMMVETRYPDLNVLDAIWINAKLGAGPRAKYNKAVETNIIVASTDPIALDYWASKEILCKVCEQVYKDDASSIDPDNTKPGSFGCWLRLSLDEIKDAGIKATADESRINVFVIKNTS